ncbi:hypothetical protein H6F67_24355 [Microcoleus sp. FACHB-1515]|uniref:hypothetical protein n=1 Tax=Cyanophyceae TaxID=3028117 RepID=UPI001684E27A|nr:hypothetical protein [Microcoleus sp. FACHB-1515]MBD2092984.1 hypothetical protein [Microcoleus sp. FACHB-1515]
MKGIFWTVALLAASIPNMAIAQVFSPPITAPTSRPERPAQRPNQPAPAQNVRSAQLSGCQNWVLRLQNVSQSQVMVAPGTARSVEGIAQVLWQIRDGVDRGYCLVRRDGRVTAAVQYTSGGTLHYFPTESDALGGPVQ